ncbi:MAG: DUF305 domain-containing protein [Beijerinckiaceae bacterium]|nr:DUF305 domain-containing protein [Beijerinckiaceae bacterium]
MKLTIKHILLSAVIAGSATVAFAQDAMKGMDMKGMDMGKGPADEGYMKAMTTMHQGMMSMKLTGDADKDFVMMMIPHHQAAIDMAKVELQYGKDPEIKKLAEEIVGAQDREIATMKAWQMKHGS